MESGLAVNPPRQFNCRPQFARSCDNPFIGPLNKDKAEAASIPVQLIHLLVSGAIPILQEEIAVNTTDRFVVLISLISFVDRTDAEKADHQRPQSKSSKGDLLHDKDESSSLQQAQQAYYSLVDVHFGDDNCDDIQ